MSAIDGKILLTKNDCYKANKKMIPKGIVVHSTGANNPNLKRYVQPDDGIIGINIYNNNWNRSGLNICVHGFIGKDKNGDIKFYQTLPFDVCCWGCGGGSKGSYNFNPAYIQFEICEDDLTDKSYCQEAYNKAVAVCAELCKKYNISVNNIVSHKEAHDKGYGSAHVDPEHWWSKHAYTMDGFRKAVKAKLKTVRVKTKTACYLYEKAYKDPVGKSVKSTKVKKGTELTWTTDKGNGWSKVKYDGKTYYIMNANLNKSALSSCIIQKLTNNMSAKKINNDKIIKTKTIKKGEKIKIICTILSGKYAGHSYIKRMKYGTYFYAKL